MRLNYLPVGYTRLKLARSGSPNEEKKGKEKGKRKKTVTELKHSLVLVTKSVSNTIPVRLFFFFCKETFDSLKLTLPWTSQYSASQCTLNSLSSSVCCFDCMLFMLLTMTFPLKVSQRSRRNPCWNSEEQQTEPAKFRFHLLCIYKGLHSSCCITEMFVPQEGKGD